MPTSPSSRSQPMAPGADLWLMVRHDFRQSVQSLWGLAPIAGSTSRTASEAQEIGSMVAGLAAAMSGMIDAVSTVAELESGHRHPILAIVPIPDLLTTVCNSLAPLALARSVQIRLGSATGSAWTDTVHASSTLRGCLLTALKLATGGTIDVSGAPRDGMATVSIAFTGIDPAPALSRTAFVELPGLPSSPAEPFVGLGLALAARLSTAIDGDLSVSSSHATAIPQEIHLALPMAP